MPAATLEAQTPSRDGAVIVFTPVTLAGDSFANTGKEVLIFNNTGDSAITITFPIPFEVDSEAGAGLAVTSRTLTCDAGVEKMIGPFPKNIYDDDDGLVNFSYSDDADLAAAVIRLP